MAVSAPVSMTATVAPAPWLMSQARGKPLRAAHHSTGVPGAVSVAVSGVDSAGSLGWKRSWRAALGLHARDARVGAQPRRRARAATRRAAGAR